MMVAVYASFSSAYTSNDTIRKNTINIVLWKWISSGARVVKTVGRVSHSGRMLGLRLVLRPRLKHGWLRRQQTDPLGLQGQTL
jgi:hypothetical protein